MIDDNRLIHNKEIVHKLEELIDKYPEQRFGQILFNFGFLDTDNMVSLSIGNQLFIPDPFYEESKVTLNRVKNRSL